MKFRPITFFILALIYSCSTTRTSMIIADNYDQEKNETTLLLMPYGNINIPGEWTKTSYNEVSRQHFFVNKDSITIAVTKNPQEKYPFYTKSLSDGEFVRKFFEWEKDYYEKQGFTVSESTSSENFLIWTATGDKVNTIFIYGARNNFAYNFAVYTDNWEYEKKTEFLIALFNRN